MLELLERERPVVQRARQPETVRHQHFLPRPVAVIHAVQLRNRLVAFVQKHERIVRQVIQQSGRRFARQPSRKMARVILDSVAVADLLDHLQIEHGPLVEPLRFNLLALLLQFLVPPLQFRADALHGIVLGLLAHHVVRLGIDGQPHIGLLHLAQQRVDLRQALHFVAPQLDAIGVIVVRRIDLDHVAAHAKSAAREIVVVALVQNLHQLRDNLVARNLLPLFQHEQHAVVRFRRPQAVDAAHARHNHAIAPLEQRLGGRQAQLVQLIVDRGLLFDVNVARWNVRFRLVVVVVADEVLDGVLGKERLELVVELRRQRLIVRHHQRRPPHRLDHLGHREGLARPGHAQQHLVLFAVAYARESIPRWPFS